MIVDAREGFVAPPPRRGKWRRMGALDNTMLLVIDAFRLLLCEGTP